MLKDGMMAAHRYAVYWTPPPDHPLWRAGCEWLGRDPSRADGSTPPREGMEAPARYGFHATLKPPMALRGDAAAQDFLDAVARLARELRTFAMPRLFVDWLGDFMALRPADAIESDHPLRRLADACVRELDGWRAPMREDELNRRLAHTPLDACQQGLLRRWGYPHVLGHWRFHMTLTNSLPPDQALRRRWRKEAERHFAASLSGPLPCDALTVFVEPRPHAPFELARRFVMGA